MRAESPLQAAWNPLNKNFLQQRFLEGGGSTLDNRTRGLLMGSSNVRYLLPLAFCLLLALGFTSCEDGGDAEISPFLGPLTAPPVRVVNRQTGQISFDVTQDVKAGCSASRTSRPSETFASTPKKAAPIWAHACCWSTERRRARAFRRWPGFAQACPASEPS